MFTSCSKRIWVITAPFLPIILGWYLGSTVTLSLKLLKAYNEVRMRQRMGGGGAGGGSGERVGRGEGVGGAKGRGRKREKSS